MGRNPLDPDPPAFVNGTRSATVQIFHSESEVFRTIAGQTFPTAEEFQLIAKE